ncbi:longitudinals lacking protein, isoforms A/B/D/L-like [Rhodnius prolixus]|uniref:longitudinals lacking protein, isoforms A/B/D/L-like n=1 Tax=Rhodnius prolixus TaxID=13249 RepID=UPI003D18C390
MYHLVVQYSASSTKKGKAQKFTCPDCLRIYKHKARMESHRKYECVSQPSIQCPYCPYKVKQRSVMGRHVAARHWVK